MFRALPALVLGLSVAACAAPLPTTPPIAVPTATTPADLCAHAQLRITNRSDQGFDVSLNGGWGFTADPQSDRTVVDYGVDRPPTLPWKVEVTGLKDRSVVSFVVARSERHLVSITADAQESQTLTKLASSCEVSEPPPNSAGPTGDPYAGLPSNACGGFHLKVVNATSGSVTVSLNDAWTSTLATGANQVITYPFTQPQPPLLPWHVTIKDASGRTLYAAIAGDSPVDQKITLTNDAAPSQAPYSIAQEGCGPA